MPVVKILKSAVGQGASDVHLVVGKPPMMRLNDEMVEMEGFPSLDSEKTKSLIYSLLYEAQRLKFEENWELDASFGVDGLGRFRINVFVQKNGVEAVMRIIPSKIPAPDEIDFTSSMIRLAALPRGLVLVTGHTGSGKSTTLACMLELINQRDKLNIVTIEDPIEFVYENKKSIFRQREVGHQTKSFANALRSAMRQDPDVILVGEMRDLETIQLAITAAETGHLCFATLHTQDAPSTVDRIIDVFPAHQQTQIRVQLASTLQAVISQTLIPTKENNRRVAAREIMIVTPAISNLIREGKTHMIYNAVETGAQHGMVSMDNSLAGLVRRGHISYQEALAHAHSADSLKQMCGGLG